ncbi:MAG: nicotinate phosphoribosyltransferase [Coriobacteriia bacterium]|nr:nicotinate phosphoribosyltransferase [Coriobacteriia bacterium]
MMKQKPIVDPMLTDLYQLTMAQGYFLSGKEYLEANFTIFFRENPFSGGFAIAGGIEPAIEFLDNFGFTDDDIAYLATLEAGDGTHLFVDVFLKHLKEMKFACNVEAVEEGTVIFAREPIFKVSGPIEQCQIVETTLLNIINFSTLVATKAARCNIAAKGDAILEFGLRRAQGPDGGLMASRASFIGGCAATSNTLAGQVYDIPVAGTHAHSWIMAFDSEKESFDAYVETSPNNVVLLVDTYDTLRGVKYAIESGRAMEARGEHFVGIRIDSGDLAWLSKEARKMLDDAGLTHAKIFASNELDEYTISSLKDQGAPIDVWGVGTKMATAFDQPALGGVYKLTAIRKQGDETWSPRIKVSSQANKITTPGIHGVRRYVREDGSYAGDMVYDLQNAPKSAAAVMVDPFDSMRRKRFETEAVYWELLIPMFESGRLVYELPTIRQVQARAHEGIRHLHETQLRFLNPHTYPVGLEQSLYDVRNRLLEEARSRGNGGSYE